jgi:hypothetical protein
MRFSYPVFPAEFEIPDAWRIEGKRTCGKRYRATKTAIKAAKT